MLAMLIGVAGVIPAHAGVASATITVSCDGVTWQSNNSYLRQATTGPASVKQTNTSPTSSTTTHMQSITGNNTTDKTISNGQTATWTGVPADTTGYRVWGRRSVPLNCNGTGLGHGNYQWSYTQTTT